MAKLPSKSAISTIDDADLMHVVDVSDTTADPLGTSKKSTLLQIKDYVQAGLYDDRGNYDASVNAYPSSGGSGAAGAIRKGDKWRINVPGTLPTDQFVENTDEVRALVDGATNTQSDWAITQGNIAFNVVAIYSSGGVPTFYETITLAIAAASSGEIIHIFSDITENITLKDGVNIDAHGHSLSGSTTDTIIGVGVTMTIYNWNVTNTTSTKSAIKLTASSDVETHGCTFDSVHDVSTNSGSVVNSDFSGSVFLWGLTATTSNISNVEAHIGVDFSIAILGSGTIRNSKGFNAALGTGINWSGDMYYCEGHSLSDIGIEHDNGAARFCTGIVAALGGDNRGILSSSNTSFLYNCVGKCARDAGIEGYNIYNCTGTSTGTGSASGITVLTGGECKNSVAISLLGTGLEMNGLLVSNCDIKGGGASQALDVRVSNCTIDNCNVESIEGTTSTVIKMDVASAPALNVRIRKCTIVGANAGKQLIDGFVGSTAFLTGNDYKGGSAPFNPTNINQNDATLQDAQGNRIVV